MGDMGREQLVWWFEKYSRNPGVEIEARIKNVNRAGWEAVFKKLSSNKAWSNTPAERYTRDLIHSSGVRETVEVSTRSRSFMRKNRIVDPFDVQLSPSHTVRFAVASEDQCSEDDTPVHTWREKKRTTFVHKELFSFELTRVKQGGSAHEAQYGPEQFEIELEFCGQRGSVHKKEYLAESMIMKVKDILRQLEEVAAGGGDAPAPKRQRTTDDGLSEGQPVRLQPGTSVLLESAGPGLPAPFGGEMPAELAGKVSWAFSHVVPDNGGGGAPQVHIMSLPCALDARRYPLFYFSGTVPKASMVLSPPA